MKIKLLLLSFLCCVSLGLFAQKGIFGENSVVYARQRSGGASAMSNGFAFHYQFGKHIDGFKRGLYTFEYAFIRHPKEIKSVNPFFPEAKSYVYGKQYGASLIRAGYGVKRVRFDKLRENGVQISTVWSIGPTLALLNPVYLDIVAGDPPNQRISVERYNPEKHNSAIIYGKSSFTNGLGQLKFVPGIHLKAGLNFEYAPDLEMIKALEIGFVLDAFTQELKIMATERNQQVLANIYLSLQFGKRYKR